MKPHSEIWVWLFNKIKIEENDNDIKYRCSNKHKIYR